MSGERRKHFVLGTWTIVVGVINVHLHVELGIIDAMAVMRGALSLLYDIFMGS